MATKDHLLWQENSYLGGLAQVAVASLWGLFVLGKHLLSEYRRSPWLVHRVEPAIVSLAFGGLVFLAIFIALGWGVRAVTRGEVTLPSRRVLSLLILSGIVMAFIIYSMAECLVLAWVILLAWAIGRVASRYAEIITGGPQLAEFTTSVGIGLALLIWLTAALGFGGWLYRGVIYILLSGLTLLLLRPILTIINQLWDACHDPIRSSDREPDGFRVVSISLLGALIAMSSVSAIAPEVGYDALTYHLAASKIFAEQHRIVEIPEMTPSYWPANGVALYTFALLLSGPKLAKLFNFGFGLLLAAAIYVIAKRYLSGEVAIRAALIFFSLPLVFWESGTAYNDLSMSFFCLLGILLFLEASHRSRSGDLYAMALSGLAFGTALGFKPIGLVIMAPLAIMLLVNVARRGTSPLREGFISTLILFSISAIFSFHWYLRSYLYTGNPVFPYFNSLFRSPYWPGPDLLNLSTFGMGAKPLDLIMLPWNITFYPQRFVEVGTLGILFLAFLPLLPHAKSLSGAGPWLLLVCVSFLAFWIQTGQYARYLLPVLPLVAILYSGAIVGFCRERLRWRRLPVCIIHAVLVAAVVEQAVLWFPSDDTRFPYRVALGKESGSDYLARVMPSSKVWAYANEHLGGSAVLLSVGNEFTFFSNRRTIPFGWFSAVFTARSPDCFFDLKAEHVAYRALLRCGYTHILIDRSSPYFKSGQLDHTVLTRDSFYNTYLQREYAFGEVSLYKVRRL